MWTLFVLVIAPVALAAVQNLTLIRSSSLGRDPPTTNHLNGEAFQQDPLITFNNWQYAAYYTPINPTPTSTTPRVVTIARRELSNESDWQILYLNDYQQTVDDGHNIISMGISANDGVLHLSFDHHDVDLHYRASQVGVATHPETIEWTASIFDSTVNILPGLDSLNVTEHFKSVTYPRFLPTPSGDLLFEFRVGYSGLGDDWLYQYHSDTGLWSLIGMYLKGVANNAYINGLDISQDGTLQVTWVYRDIVTGTNGPENNHGMYHSLSTSLGATWQNTWGQTIANVSNGQAVIPLHPGIAVYDVPKYSGVLNQEAQTIDSKGRVHVLNRDNTSGTEQWYHYWRTASSSGSIPLWTRYSLPPSLAGYPDAGSSGGIALGKRGKVAPYVYPDGSEALLMILPTNLAGSTALKILASTPEADFEDWQVVWEIGSGCGWEPLFDKGRSGVFGTSKGWTNDGVLSLFVTNGTEVQVWDLGS